MYTIFGFYKFKKIKSLKKYQLLFQREITKNNVRGTIILSSEGINGAIAGKKPWPELIISVSGSKGSKFKLTNNINYKGLKKWKIKTYKRNNHNH